MSKTPNKSKSHKFKLNDWVFSEFKLKRVKEMNGDKVTSVTDEYFTSGYRNYNDQLFHVDPKIKIISDTYSDYYNKLNKLNFNSLNYPDINGYFIEHWIKTCKDKNNEDFVRTRLDDIREFTNKICNAVDDILYMEIDGVRLCRQ